MAPKISILIKRVGAQFRHKNDRREEQRHDNDSVDPFQHKMKRCSTVEVTGGDVTHKPRRLSLTLKPRRFSRGRRSSEITFLEPAFPPEIIENIASFLTQRDLTVFSRVSRDAYTAAERHLYRRPFTRRFDKLLRTLERVPHKADLIRELALGFETDFYSVKYCTFVTS
jgi:hypothetical protein